MELDAIYENVEGREIKSITGPQTQSHSQDEGRDQKRRGSRYLVLITVSFGLICVLLLVFIIMQHITVTAERDLIKSYKNTVEEFNQTINSLQDNYTDLINEKDQLQGNFNSLSQKNLELETRVNELTAEKDQLQTKFNSLNQKKLELDSDQLKKEFKKVSFFISNEKKSWSDSRQYCRDHGADLVIINSEEKQRFISSYFKDVDRAWIGLSDTENEGNMVWVDDSPLIKG
ncbi:hypothetical protein QQF64_036167, partial [Cirrhinus molitorella]